MKVEGRIVKIFTEPIALTSSASTSTAKPHEVQHTIPSLHTNNLQRSEIEIENAQRRKKKQKKSENSEEYISMTQPKPILMNNFVKNLPSPADSSQKIPIHKLLSYNRQNATPRSPPKPKRAPNTSLPMLVQQKQLQPSSFKSIPGHIDYKPSYILDTAASFPPPRRYNNAQSSASTHRIMENEAPEPRAVHANSYSLPSTPRLTVNRSDREIISICFGGAGASIGNAFWQRISGEHGVMQDATISRESFSMLHAAKINSFFSFRKRDCKLRPRCLFVDGAPDVHNRIKALSPIRALFSESNFASSKVFSNGNYGIASNRLYGDILSNPIFEQLRKLEEECDSLQGYIFFESVGGGIGSAISVAVAESSNHFEKEKTILNCPVFPADGYATNEMELFNAVLALQRMNACQVNMIMENQALMDICVSRIKSEPDFKNMNHLISLLLSSVTAPLRYNGSNAPCYSNLQQLSSALVTTTPHLMNFVIPTYAPFTNIQGTSKQVFSLNDTTLQVLDVANSFIKRKSFGSPHALSMNYRSNALHHPMELKSIYEVLTSIKLKKPSIFSKALRNDTFKYGVVNGKSLNSLDTIRQDVSCLMNTSAIETFMEAHYKKYTHMLATKSFMHYYTQAGIEELELIEAGENLNKIINAYASTKEGTLSL